MFAIIYNIIGAFVILYRLAVYVGQFIAKNAVKLLMGGKLQNPPPVKISGLPTSQKKPSVKPDDQKQPPGTGSSTTGSGQRIESKGAYFRVINGANHGNQIASHSDISEWDCGKVCSANWDCLYFNYDTTQKQCTLHKKEDRSGIDSGTKRTDGAMNLFVDSYIPGLNVTTLNTAYLAECKNACIKNIECHWMDYNKKSNLCELKKATEKDGMIHAHKS